MTNLKKLSVSLTKHGAHKVAALLEHFNPNDVLANTWDTYASIKIDAAQARKNLSAFHDDTLPAVWVAAKKRGRGTIKGLVLVAIILSHHDLIEAFVYSSTGPGQGTIKRDQFSARKSFSNLKNDIFELGFSVTADEDKVSYDLRSLIADQEFGALVGSLLRLKLSEAGWSGTNDIVDESISLGLQGVFGLTEVQFRGWVSGGNAFNLDELPDVTDPEKEAPKPFAFKPGHVARKEGEVARRGHGKTPTARLLHNQIQNALFAYLAHVHGSGAVGTEVPTGSAGTSIDVVVQANGTVTFFEIKTSGSLKKCIREALPQLLEYAYWPAEKRASKLVIVSLNKATADGAAYLEKLRGFGLPLFHQTCRLPEGELTDEI